MVGQEQIQESRWRFCVLLVLEFTVNQFRLDDWFKIPQPEDNFATRHLSGKYQEGVVNSEFGRVILPTWESFISGSCQHLAAAAESGSRGGLHNRLALSSAFVKVGDGNAISRLSYRRYWEMFHAK